MIENAPSNPSSNTFNQALEAITDHYECPEIATYQAYHLDYERAQTHAVFSHSVESGSTRTDYYDFYHLAASTINYKDDFTGLLNRYFASEVADAFNFDKGEESVQYAVEMFKHFVHDKDSTPKNLSDVTINLTPKANLSENALLNKLESELYANPTFKFKEAYQGFCITGATQYLNNRNYPLARKEEFQLSDILDKENVRPLLRLLIKLWIIRQVKLLRDSTAIDNHDFFSGQDVDALLQTLELKSSTMLNQLIAITPERRREVASKELTKNRFKLSLSSFKLAQRLSFLRLIFGHGRADIHANPDNTKTFGQKSVFYLKSYLNIDLMKHMFNQAKDSLKDCTNLAKKIMTGKGKLVDYPKAFYKLLKPIYLGLWAPFICSYFALSGMTSAPFSFIRKAFKIQFGGKVDYALTLLESIKDIGLAGVGLYMSAGFIASMTALILPEMVMMAGIHAAQLFGLAIMSPILAWTYLDHCVYTYPNWFADQYGDEYFYAQSPFDSTLGIVANVARLPLVVAHTLVAATALIGLSTVISVGYLYNRINSWYGGHQIDLSGLFVQAQNMNHSQPLRKFFAELSEKAKENKCDENEKMLLVELGRCQLNAKQQQILSNYLKDKCDNPEVVSKNTFRIAQMHVKRDGYLLSYKLTNALKQDLSSMPELEGLRDAVERNEGLFEKQLSAYKN